MIKSTVSKFGVMFVDAITVTHRVTIRREANSESGYIIIAEFKTWASISAMDNGEQAIDTFKITLTDIADWIANGSGKFVDMGELVADDSTGLDITDNIEKIMSSTKRFTNSELV